MTASESKQPGGAYMWGVLALLTLGLLISFIDRTSLSAALADKHFVQEFALSSVERG